MSKLSKLFAFVSALIMTVTLGAGTARAAEATDPYPEIEKIATSEILEQNEDSYYVYFYKANCPYCNEVKEAINEFAAGGGEIYAVDYGVLSNRVNGYDWTEVAAKYNKKIGWIDNEGRKNYLPGESEEKYLNNTEVNMYGKVIRYQITEINEYNVDQFEGAEIGDIYTDVQTPEIDYASVKDTADLVIAGVPTMLHVSNGEIDGFYFDSVEIAALLANM
ncbi:hypothetical protein INF30_12345 [Lachnospiraceae bacterium DSM 108991]|uniref:Uncharacterized protein n=1 Tax=Claveliimonas monacensis TaxID=2779351 RepID=A0ABR9RM22_9FIRM|nr:hypothetical protein [Claveliimonas monacensis]MBE5064043.1 hypothetical protein [Claveliimonas monacensis]